MGKWTSNYTDDVLHGKMSNLVSGSIRRAAVEKEPSITYENFVNDLDTGDSFTASLIDILVKELADRRTRETAHDRTLIAERTIRSLRQLSSNARRYSNRLPTRTQPRRPGNLTGFFSSNEMHEPEFDEDDEFDVVMENPTIIEGVRVNSDLYEAFSTTPWPPPGARRIPSSPPASDGWSLPQAPRSPSVTRPWSAVSTVSTSNPPPVIRQASVRRAVRSRLVDFHDRRRPYTRETMSRSEPPESVTEPRESSGYPSNTVRRFFPRTRRNQTNVIPWSENSDTVSLDSDDQFHGQFFALDPANSWYDPDPTLDSSRASPDVESRETTESLLRAPRLRYVGTLPPEHVFSRHASPVPPFETTSAAPPSGSPSSSPLHEGSAFVRVQENEEPVAYPTPGSTENENVS